MIQSVCPEKPTLRPEKERANIAEIRLNQKNKRIDIAYDYLIPEALSDRVLPGVRVVVPFGTGSRALEGFVTACKTDSDYGNPLRAILSVIDASPVLTPNQCALCDWLHRYYFSLFYEALTLFTAPVKVVHKRKKDADGNLRDVFEPYAPKRMPVSAALTDQSSIDDAAGTDQLDFDRQKLKAAVLENDLPVFYEDASQKRRFKVYCYLADQVCRAQGQVLILLPDVFSVHALKSDFYAHFGIHGRIYSGDLKPAERYGIYQDVRHGHVSVIMGTRAALFLPFCCLSLMIQDEPDDSAYFGRSMPRYDTLRVVQTYSRISGAKYLFGGSALPLQIYLWISQNHVRHIQTSDSKLPAVEIVDMQSEMRRGNLDFISGLLKQRMEDTVNRGEKVLLMLNRRGMAGYMLCRACGHVEKCSRCGISLKPYTDDRLHCPYCGQIKEIPKTCPQCHSARFRPVGLGIEKAMTVLKQRYPDWRILQLDASLLNDPDVLNEVRYQLDAGNWDVVIGTRILLKDWHFQSVGLAAVLLMDEILNHGDYNDSEKGLMLFRRFFALSGKEAIAQTYEPEHEVVHCLAQSEWRDFYDSEAAYRKMMYYPPLCHLAIFSVMDLSELQAGKDAHALYHALLKFDRHMPEGQYFQIYQPVLAGIQPKTGRYRYKIMVKISQIALLQQMTAALIAAGEIEKLKSKVSIEIDPDETI